MKSGMETLCPSLLQVQILGGIGLVGSNKSGLSDVYVSLWLDKERKIKYKTSVVRGTTAPSWDFERWTVRLPASASTLFLRVKNTEPSSKRHEVLGIASLDLTKGGFNETPSLIALAISSGDSKRGGDHKKSRGKKHMAYLKLNISLKNSPPVTPFACTKASASATELLFRALLQKDLSAAFDFLKSPPASEANYNCACFSLRFRGARGLTPLLIALTHPEPAPRLQLVQQLLEKGASPLHRVEQTAIARIDQLTPLYYAATCGLPAECVLLLESASGQRDPDHAAHCLLDGSTPLMGSIVSEHLKTMRTLLEKGASANKANETGVTALIMAAHHNRGLEFLEALVGQGRADVNARTIEHATALYEYARHGNSRAVEYLLGKGAVNVAHKCGMTPLLAALARGHTACATLLIPSCARDGLLDASLHHTSGSGLIARLNALSLATLLLKKGIIRVLIQHGASVDGNIVLGAHSKPTTAVIEGLGFGEYLPQPVQN